MDQEPKNPFVARGAPKLGEHPPITESPVPAMIETPDKSDNKRRAALKLLGIAAITALIILALFIVAFVIAY